MLRLGVAPPGAQEYEQRVPCGIASAGPSTWPGVSNGREPYTGTAATGYSKTGIPGAFQDHHHVMTRIRQEVTTRMPWPDESQALHLRRGVPVLDAWLTSIDQDGEPCELTWFVMRGDMTGLLYDVPVG